MSSIYHPAEVGFVSSHDDWEYPLWVYLAELSATPVRIEHVLVQNSTRRIVAPRIDAFRPCAIVSVNPALNAGLAASFTEIWSSEHVAVFVRR